MPPKKAKPQPARRPVTPLQASAHVVSSSVTLLLLFCVCVAAVPHLDRLLHPVYGATASQWYLRPAASACVLLGGVLGVWRKGSPSLRQAKLLLPAMLFASAWAATLGFHFGDRLGPVAGALAAHSLTLFPLLLLSSAILAGSLADSASKMIQKTSLPPTYAIPGVLFMFFDTLVQFLSHPSLSTYLPRCRALNLLAWNSAALVTADLALTARKRKSRLPRTPLALLTFICALALALRQPAWCHPGPGVSVALAATHEPDLIHLYDRKESVTGWISVGEYAIGDTSMLVMRCDHSLLGGIWIGYARAGIRDEVQRDLINETEGDKLEAMAVQRADTVYVTFIVQEAVRLIENRNFKTALVIGLGIGTSTRALIEHGLDVSIVELDPAVYSFAREYFALPMPTAIYLQDARQYLKKSRGSYGYDIIVHDVFTGGTVPSSLFTRETWLDIKASMKSPQGVAVVNFAGSSAGQALPSVLLTLLDVFAYCRAFQDKQAEEFELDHLNLVIFCSDAPITFRRPVDADFLGSGTRQGILSDFETREWPLEQDSLQRNASTILTDANAFKLTEWQRRDALWHWSIMRSTLTGDQWRAF